ncbi:MAG TPA: hypothetical protein VGF98_11275 [Candidatus Tumulicola sp.]|jgi:hypothetical protein
MHAEYAGMDEKRFRVDLYIASLALIFSGLAAAAAAYQTYVIRQQFSATVWPYLTFISSTSGKGWFELDLNNAGIGPALIRTAVISRDGKPVKEGLGPTSLTALGTAIAPERAEASGDEARANSHIHNDLTVTSLTRGDVIPAGSRIQLIRIVGSFLTKRVVADAHHIDISVCYCSLLGDCWTKRLWDPAAEPHSIRACPTT